jgi:tetratricopeptide (TPR) repeat protein
LISEGIKWLQRKEYDLALKSFDEAVRLEHDRATTYYLRAEAWYRKGYATTSGAEFYERAANDYSVAILLQPDFAEAYTGLGNAYVQLERYSLAFQNHSEAIRRSERGFPPFGGPSGAQGPHATDQSGPAILPGANVAQAYRGRAAAHTAFAKLYALRNDGRAMQQELSNAADDFNRASQVRLAGAEDSPIATLSPEAKPQAAH